MATTTNYGWTTPDDTALVKDGASAIRTLGSSVDTTTKNLNPETTLGDIAYRSSTANVNTRLALGTAGQVLQVNSGATAPEWATPASGGMTLISTTTLSGASITLSSIPATYNNLFVVIRNFLPATDNAAMSLRVNGDSGSRYRPFNTYGINATPVTPDNDEVVVTGVQDNAVAQNITVITFFDYANTTTFKMWATTSITNDSTTPTNVVSRQNYAMYNQTGALSSITLYPNTGNFTSGSVLLYGVK